MMWHSYGTGAAWHGPRHQIPVHLSAPGLIWRTDAIALALTDIDVFTDLVEFAFVIWPRYPPPPPRGGATTIRGGRMRMHHGRDALSPEFLRIGVVVADGRTATNIEEFVPREGIEPNAPGADLVFVPVAGRAGPDVEEQRFRMWPLPPPGRFELVLEWPAYGLAERHIPLDADAVRAAAATVEPIWPDDPV